ncbi:ankyrin repeat domain-containing protein, partial [Bacteroidota bacterium]
MKFLKIHLFFVLVITLFLSNNLIAEENLDSLLIEAVNSKKFDLTKELIEKGANIEATNKNGSTPLLTASYYGNLDMVKYLISNNADIKALNEYGNSALYIASYSNHIEIARLLIEKGLDVNRINNSNWTPLLSSAYAGNLEIVKLLIGSRVDVNLSNNNGVTALMWATYKGHLDIIKLLVENGADYTQKGLIYNRDKDNSTYGSLISIAAGKNYVDILKYFIEDLKIEVDDKELSTNGNEDGWTALQWASFRGCKEAVEYLVSHNANVDEKYKGTTALMYAARTDQKEVIELLLSKNAKVNEKDNAGWTALMYASRYGHKDVVELLINNNAQVNDTSRAGWSSLYIAVTYGNQDVAEILTSNGADVNIIDKKGNTVIQIAHSKSFKDMALNLYYNGAETDIFTLLFLGFEQEAVSLLKDSSYSQSEYDSLLHIAFNYDMKDFIKSVVDAGAKINSSDADGNHLLHKAVLLEDIDLVKLIISFKANVNLVDFEGYTPYMLAKIRSNEAIQSLLVKNGARKQDIPQKQPELRIQTGHSWNVQELCYTPDSKTLISCSNGQYLKFWDVETGKEINNILSRYSAIYSVNVSPDGKHLVYSSYQCPVAIVDIFTGKTIKYLNVTGNPYVRSLKFSPDGKLLACLGKDIKIWDFHSGKENLTIKINHPYRRFAGEIKFSPNSRILAFRDSSIKLYNISTGSQFKIFNGHSKRISTFSFSNDSKHIISGSYDSTIIIWDIFKGKAIHAISELQSHISSISRNTVDELFAVG